MPEKSRRSVRDRKYSTLVHLEEQIKQFLRRYSRPSNRYEHLSRGLEEVGRERALLYAEINGAPTLRKLPHVDAGR